MHTNTPLKASHVQSYHKLDAAAGLQAKRAVSRDASSLQASCLCVYFNMGWLKFIEAHLNTLILISSLHIPPINYT